MKRCMLCLLLAMSFATGATKPPPSGTPTFSPTPQEEKTARVVAEILERYEYRKIPLDATLSDKVFDAYLKILDPDKLIFLQSDIASFSGDRDIVAEEVRKGELHIPFDIFNVYVKRVAERLAFADDLLDHAFNFESHESFLVKRDAQPWAPSELSLRNSWRKRVKNDWLRLKLAGENDAAIRQTLGKRYRNNLLRLYQAKSEDVFQAFMDAYAKTIDPHTDYLGLQEARELDAAMRLSMVGVGVVLEQVGEYMVIRELVPGSPAALSNKLNVGDRITAIGQGEHGALVDVVGWRTDDAVTLAQGASGSIVRLQVSRGDRNVSGKPRVVTLVRNKVRFEDQAAKMTSMKIGNDHAGKTIAVISLPIFYEDFEARSKGEKNFKSATNDVLQLLLEAKKKHVDGLLIDLRNNGGGSLDEAVRLTGLFIGNGPVLQVRDAHGEIKLLKAEAGEAAWDGPLGVLINRRSASASEIFAAAIQDYGRGAVIGEASFGKGTVQAVVDLDKLIHSEQPQFGELKVTIAQFFRVNGSSTQLRGVVPDVAFPSDYDAGEIGEASFDNALPWAEIAPASYARRTGSMPPAGVLQHLHDVRIANDRDFQGLQAEIAEIRLREGQASISLNERDRRKERDDVEAQNKLREKKRAGSPKAAQDSGLDLGESSLADVLAAEKSAKGVMDPELNEAVQVVGDEVNFAARKQSNSSAGARAPN
ncbi:MAG TPA: carboxy terminal-processing peptidase [Burkholderiaceae bacterium]